jgi:hypothetical protein
VNAQVKLRVALRERVELLLAELGTVAQGGLSYLDFVTEYISQDSKYYKIKGAQKL